MYLVRHSYILVLYAALCICLISFLLKKELLQSISMHNINTVTCPHLPLIIFRVGFAEHMQRFTNYGLLYVKPKKTTSDVCICFFGLRQFLKRCPGWSSVTVYFLLIHVQLCSSCSQLKHLTIIYVETLNKTGLHGELLL